MHNDAVLRYLIRPRPNLFNVVIALTLIRHVLPAALPAVTVQATLGMAGAILVLLGFNFIGGRIG